MIDITNNLDGGRSQSFDYDGLNRLKTAQTQATTGEHCFGETFGYDKWANLLNIGRITPAYDACTQENLSVGVDINNQINNPGFDYDAAGNLIDDGDGPGTHTYQYDAENRLVTVDGGSTATYSYDGDGQRVQKSSGTLCCYGPGGEVLQETTSSGTLLRDFIYFNGQRVARREANNTVYFFFSDHLGSARVVTDASGSVVEESDFYPFGREIVITDLLQGSQDNPYKFTGLERDTETGLDHTVFRKYGFTLARWLSPDALGGGLISPQTLNRYAYVANNPLRYIDPLGLFRQEGSSGPGPARECRVDGYQVRCGMLRRFLAGGHSVRVPRDFTGRIVQGPQGTLINEFYSQTIAVFLTQVVIGQLKLHREILFEGVGEGSVQFLMLAGVRFQLAFTSEREGWFFTDVSMARARQALADAGFSGVVLDHLNVLHQWPYWSTAYRSPTPGPSLQFAFPLPFIYPETSIPSQGTFDVDAANPVFNMFRHIEEDLLD